MIFRIIAVSSALMLAGCGVFGSRELLPNPDPNHTHADFAVWMNGEQMDFSGPENMSGLSDDETTHDEADEAHHPYYHLHDGNGYVIHRHKPGLPLQDFFDSLEVGFSGNCYTSFRPMEDGQVCGETPFLLFVNGVRRPFDLSYIFEDDDQILITNAADDVTVAQQIKAMTDDACRYSKRCPWKGEVPVENCVSDPDVPCMAPLD